MMDTDVLIIGAGPTGLILALWLTKLGVKVRIVDRTAESGTTSRALAVQARTLELYRQLDLADAVVARGHEVPAINLWVTGKPAARLSFETVGSDLTPYSFLEIFPQDEHERLLIDRLAAAGVLVERRCELIGFKDEGDRIVARLRNPRDAKISAQRITSPDATAPVPSCARLLARDSPAAPIASSSTLPMLRRPALQ
jgi:2-polyprenyl-6-methoxyphenol hydroxylase-like FAD-dependent oxidoreductase